MDGTLPHVPPASLMSRLPHPLSRSISAWNYIQLLTPHSSRIFKHQLLTNQHSHLYPNDHHCTAHVSQHSITMPSPYTNKSFFDDPSDIEMDDLSLPKQPLCIKKSLWSIQSTFQCECTPVSELPGIPQLALYNNPITPTIPINPLFPPCLQPKPPDHLGEDISEIGMGTRFVSIEAQDPQYYWINCQMDNTGIRFAVRVDRCLVIDPNPQNMSSWLDRVGKLIGLWCGHLFEFVHRS